jgi:hypothetical protein
MSLARRCLGASAAILMSLSLAALPAPARAQDSAVSVERKITLDLRETPLRDAVALLFRGSGLQYAIDPNVTNVPITLNIRDVPLESALRLVIRQAASLVPGLTSTRDGNIYSVRIRQAAPMPQATLEEQPPEYTAGETELTWEKIPIQFNNVAVFALAFGGTMLPTEDMVIGGGMMGGGMGGMGGGYGGGMMGGMGGMMGGGFGGGMGGFGGGMGGFGRFLGGKVGSSAGIVGG